MIKRMRGNLYIFMLGVFYVMIAMSHTAFAQPSAEELQGITQRGQLLYEYDSAAWTASDVIIASKPDNSLVRRYIARKIGNSWEVAFGKFNADKTAFVVNYKYTQNVEMAKKVKLPYDDQDYYFRAALAIESAMDKFRQSDPRKRPYNIAILPNEDKFYVYLYPAPIKKHVYPLGGDWRYLVSTDGQQILETRQLHKGILESSEPIPNHTKAGYHIAILDNRPEDTDVFHVLQRKPSIPELVATRDYLYQIETDGSIKYLGLTKDILKK